MGRHDVSSERPSDPEFAQWAISRTYDAEWTGPFDFYPVESNADQQEQRDAYLTAVPNATEDQLQSGLYTLDTMQSGLGRLFIEDQARAVLALSFFDQDVILSGGVGPATKRVTDRMSDIDPNLIRSLASVGEAQVTREGIRDTSAADARRVIRDMKGASLAAAELLAVQRGADAAGAYMEALEKAAQDINTKKATKAELANVARLLQLDRPEKFRSWSAVPKAELKDLIEDQLDTIVNPHRYNPAAQPFTTATGTKSTLEALDAAGWGMLITPDSYRPARVQFALEHGMPLALDNGAYASWTRGEDWESTQRAEFEKRARELGGVVEWIVAPDIVAGGAQSLELSEAWIPWLLERTEVVLLPVQDGMSPEDVAPVIAEHHPRVGIFLGGSTEWKWETAHEWGRLADAWRVPYHVARVNSLSAIRRAGSVGASSWDGTGPVQFPSSLERLERGHRQQTMALLDAGAPCCAAPDLAEDFTGTWCVNCGEQTEPGAVPYSSIFPDVDAQEERERRRTEGANPVPPAEVAAVARQALSKRAASAKARPGGTAVGLARARDLANRRNLSEDTLRRMVSFFARHDGHQEREARKDPDSPAAVAWDLWGGDLGRSWAIESLDRLGPS